MITNTFRNFDGVYKQLVHSMKITRLSPKSEILGYYIAMGSYVRAAVYVCGV